LLVAFLGVVLLATLVVALAAGFFLVAGAFLVTVFLVVVVVAFAIIRLLVIKVKNGSSSIVSKSTIQRNSVLH